ncbi:MAG: Rpn family recombination-promoting nuclease/putative transposase [Gemmatimonadetes bacterium]|nr:Rpn family recombination-promoting nuclease/putative transposase [Gemmatimonadota bacterium]MYF72869.1 Rpn family recombination-promoting nuclease/putative transposase [Gemmatimonadota bacterium]MYK50307.1 Rpn family recombination-promoting nuclease/putative transposase [Gemmatimonadota bacterium]
MAEYDTVSKDLIQTYPKDFIRLTLEQDDIEVLDILDTEQSMVDTRYADSLIRVQIAGQEALVHHEFQTTDDASMPLRMAGYIIRAMEQHGLPVSSSVIYLRRSAGRRDPGYYVQDFLGRRVLIEYTVIRLSEIEGQDIIDGGPSGLFPFVPLMKRPSGIDSEAWLHHCVDATNALPVDESIKIDFLGRLMILSGLEYDPILINRILLQEGLMDAIMRESLSAQYIKQLGIEQGIEQGERRSMIEAILDVLEIRFDLSEAHPLSARIAAIDDLQRLKPLHRAAIQVSSLEAFEQVLDG